MVKDLLNVSFGVSGTQKISKRVPIAKKPRQAIPNVSSAGLDTKRLAKPNIMADSTQEALSTTHQMHRKVHQGDIGIKKIFQSDKKPPQAIPKVSKPTRDNKKLAEPIPTVRSINMERLYDLNKRDR